MRHRAKVHCIDVMGKEYKQANVQPVARRFFYGELQLTRRRLRRNVSSCNSRLFWISARFHLISWKWSQETEATGVPPARTVWPRSAAARTRRKKLVGRDGFIHSNLPEQVAESAEEAAHLISRCFAVSSAVTAARKLLTQRRHIDWHRKERNKQFILVCNA